MPVSGKLIGGGMIGFAVIFGVGLWYAQTRAHFEEVSGLTSVTIGGKTFPVRGYRGIDGPRTPLKLRGCFTLDDPEAAIAAGEPAEDAVPLTTPGWFDCFDPEAIEAAIASGDATAIMAGEDEGDGADLYMAIRPDGQAWQWRQPNKKYEGH